MFFWFCRQHIGLSMAHKTLLAAHGALLLAQRTLLTAYRAPLMCHSMVLLCVAICCSMLQCFAVRCSVFAVCAVSTERETIVRIEGKTIKMWPTLDYPLRISFCFLIIRVLPCSHSLFRGRWDSKWSSEWKTKSWSESWNYCSRSLFTW